MSSRFEKYADFDYVHFERGGYFYHESVINEQQEKGLFFNEAAFRSVRVTKEVIFENVNLENVWFIDANMQNFHFVNCQWAKKGIRDVLGDEIDLFPTMFGRYRLDSQKKKEIKKVEILYRKLKQKYSAEHDQTQVSLWHYGEKEMFRKSSMLRRLNPLSLSNLYWFSSGYGERPVRAGVVLIFALVVFILLLNGTGVRNLHDLSITTKTIQGFSSQFDLENCLLLIYTTFQYILFVKNPDFVPFTYWGNFWVLVFSKLIIPIQAALSMLAVRNKFRR